MATARKASSTEWVRSRATPDQTGGRAGAPSGSARPARRVRYHAMNTTLVQPRPINSRLAPVMFASASEHGEAAPGSVLGQAGPNPWTDAPPCQANTKSTAYSGSTAISASTAIARPAEMSSWATSAAHERRNAAPTIASPKSRASIAYERSGVAKRSQSAGAADRRATTTTNE